MSEAVKKRKWKRWALIPALLAVAVPLMIAEILVSGLADEYLRRTVVDQFVKATGGRAELRLFHFDPWRLHVTLDDLTIHGLEPSGTPPLFHADRLDVQLRVDSFWGRKISLGDVELMRPAVHLRFERDGSSNVPALSAPALTPGNPWRQRVFALVVRRLRLDDGELLFNDVRIPLVAEGGNFDLSVDSGVSEGRPMYLGQFHWQQMEFAALRYLPFPSDVAGRFTFESDSLAVTQLTWTIPHASLDTQFSVSNFAHPEWSFRYRGRFDSEALRTILRVPATPAGRVDVNGDGRFADGKLALTGGYSAEQIALPYQWFHTKGVTTRGTYRADQNSLEVPDFSIQVLGGTVSGRMRADFNTMQFRVDSHAQAVNLAALFAAVDNQNFPVVPLHWDGTVDVQSVTTWTAGFKNVDSSGLSIWAQPASLRIDKVPISARINYHYSMADGTLSLPSSQITTPTGGIQMNGALGVRDSAIDVVFDTQDLVPWDDFINVLRGADAEPKKITGRFHWQGRIAGPLVGPTFTGHVRGTDASYDRLYFDEIDGDLTYSPDVFKLVRASSRRGRSSAQIEVSLGFNDWSFDPDSHWSFDATLVRTDTDGVQSLLGSAYPVHGVLTGNFNGKGTRANPELTGQFDIIDPQAWNWRFDRARGELSMRHGEIRISNAELRLLPPPAPSLTQSASPPGLLTGNFLYRTTDGQAVFDLTGAVLPLEGIAYLQAPRLPVGGQLSFQVRGQGPLRAPKMQGSLRLVDLRLGSEVLGSFDGKVNSDGTRLTLQTDSAISTGELHGTLGVSLTGDYPLTGQVNIAQMDLDPFIISVLHLNALTGHSRVDGQFNITGALRRPDTLAVDANVSSLAMDYEHINLNNVGAIKFQYGNHEIRVEQANLRGMDTDVSISGSAGFAGGGALDLHLAGAVDLRLFGAFVPNLDASGPAQVDAAFAGTLSEPSITGRVHVENASVRYGDFPTGLSQVAGDLVFDASRLVFDNLTSQTGGGNVQFTGSVTYGNGPLRFDLTARSDQVRVRYPVGTSWLTGGTLRLLGTAQSSTLSGRITVDRLLISDNFDFSSLLSSTDVASGSNTASEFLRNLQLDVQTDSTSNTALQWSSGTFQSDGSVRLRGTWQRPIVLGNIHMLTGQMTFRGNQYALSRGDINFVNPFRLDPVLNIEASTTIQRYDITVDFTGTASHLTMSYRSDPPLPQSDIIALLALGQTGEESQLRSGPAGAQTAQMGATTLLSEAVSSQLGGRIQRLFGISHFSVDPSSLAETTAGQNPGARVTVAQQFAHNLVITYSTDVTSTQQQIIQIEYAVKPDLSVVALRDANGTFGIDVVRRTRFK